MAKNLKIVRLLTGEEILGDVQGTTNEQITMIDPVRILLIPSKNDPQTPSVAFAPLSQWATDREVHLNRSHVLTVLNPVPEFVNQYNAQFGGIIVPETKIITPDKK